MKSTIKKVFKYINKKSHFLLGGFMSSKIWNYLSWIKSLRIWADWLRLAIKPKLEHVQVVQVGLVEWITRTCEYPYLQEKMNITTSLPQETMYIFAFTSGHRVGTSLLKILNSFLRGVQGWNPETYIYYTLSLTIELSLHRQNLK